MQEVILYAAIATIVCVMLYSVLGKSVGKGPDEPLTFGRNEAQSTPAVVEAVPTGSTIPGVDNIMRLESGFTPNGFITGAKGAYAMILEAFAQGDKDQLAMLLTADVYSVYEKAVDEREEQGLRQVTDLARLKSAEIVMGETEGKDMKVSVRYQADLASALVNEEGETVQGDPNVLASINEVWTFTKKAGSKDPNWKLADVAASTGDELAADPTPDTSEPDTSGKTKSDKA